MAAQRGLKRLRAVVGGKERGNAAFGAGHWEEAIRHYSTSLAADPELKNRFKAQASSRWRWLQQGGRAC